MDCDLAGSSRGDPARCYGSRAGGLRRRAREAARRRQAWQRRLGARAYFRLRNALLETKVDPEHTTLSVDLAPGRRRLPELRDRDRHYLLILHWLGFRADVVEGRARRTARGSRAPTPGASYTTRVRRDVLPDDRAAALDRLPGLCARVSGLLVAVVLVALYFANRPPPWLDQPRCA